MTSKRSLGEKPTVSHDDNSGKKTKVESGGDSKEVVMDVRVLIENHQVGGIIGKAGANVRRVREESGAFISILKTDFRNVQERILVLKGNVHQILKATKSVAQLMLDNQNAREKKGEDDRKKKKQPSKQLKNEKSNSNESDTTIPFKILVHKLAVGAIIGKGGATIKETQNETGTRIQVSNEPLPYSTEKTVTITGTPVAIENAAQRVLNQLTENPLRSGTKAYPYVPGHPPYPSPYASPPYASPPPMLYGNNSPAQIYPYGSPTTTQKIAIPTVCAGCVIGNGGAVIRDLRSQSGTSISIADPDSNSPNERVVTLTGSPQGIQTAVYLIRQLVEQYQPPQSY